MLQQFSSPVTGSTHPDHALSDYANVANAHWPTSVSQATPIASDIITPVAATGITYATSYYTSSVAERVITGAPMNAAGY